MAFACAPLALAAAALDELRARVIDQIVDLPTETLAHIPNATTLSIAALVEHLLWVEIDWIERVSGAAAPVDLSAAVLSAGLAVRAGTRANPETSAAALVALCRRVRDEVTVPVLAALPDADSRLSVGGPALTVREVLMHLAWHWTYHSGQIGLLRELCGVGYEWSFGT